MNRTLAIVLGTLGIGLAGGFVLHDLFVSNASAASEATYEYEVVTPLLGSSKTKNRQKIEETIAGKAKFGWRLVEVEGEMLYFERAASGE